MTTSADPVLSAQHHELVKDELFAFARYLYEEIESHTSVNITFDENNQIRVLSSEKYRETENLKSECIDFLKSKCAI